MSSINKSTIDPTTKEEKIDTIVNINICESYAKQLWSPGVDPTNSTAMAAINLYEKPGKYDFDQCGY